MKGGHVSLHCWYLRASENWHRRPLRSRQPWRRYCRRHSYQQNPGALSERGGSGLFLETGRHRTAAWIKAFPILRPNELSFPRGEPPLSGVDLRPTLYIELKQLLKKCPILFKSLHDLMIGLCKILDSCRSGEGPFIDCRVATFLWCLAQVRLPTGGDEAPGCTPIRFSVGSSSPE